MLSTMRGETGRRSPSSRPNIGLAESVVSERPRGSASQRSCDDTCARNAPAGPLKTSARPISILTSDSYISWGVPLPSDLDEALAALASIMRAGGIRWYLFGAHAVAVYGVPRLTADIDATIEVPLEDVDELVAMVSEGGFEPRVTDVGAFVLSTRVVPVTHVATGIPVDLVVAGPGLEEEFLSRARDVDVGGVAIPVISPEDLIATKVLAGRPKDLEDVLGIIRDRGSELDLDIARRSLALLDQALDRDDLVRSLDAIVHEARRARA